MATLPELRDYDRWRAGLEEDLGPYRDFILVLPDVVSLLVRLTRDRRVPLRYKLYLGGALAYFVSPVDLVPDVPGPLGHLDDLVIAVTVLNLLVNRIDPAILEEHWSGDGDLLLMVRDIVERADGWIGRARLERILDHLGLTAPSV